MLSRRRRKRRIITLSKWIFLVLVVLFGIPLLMRGIKLPWTSSNIPVINIWNVETNKLMKMSLDEYVKGVVAAEMPVTFELEALKAQAVVARTYAYQRIVNNVRISEHEDAHLSTDFSTGQAWISADKLRERWGLVEYFFNNRKLSQAVSQTEGIIATYDNKPILAVYHSTSGGRTENSEHYWTDSLPYLRSVADPYGEHSPYQYTTLNLSLAEFTRLMEIDSAGKIKVIERYPSGRVKTMEAGNRWFSGREVRQRLGLRSSWFTIDLEANRVQFSVWGYGHGVGMPQYSADGMARAGYDYKQILKYYYQGISLEKLY